MTLPPETRYAPAADGLNIAYQVTGGGDVDLVFMQGAVAHLELAWEDTRLSRLFEQKGRADRFSFPQFGQSMSLFS